MQRRLIVILAFPIIAFVFLIGWVLYCIGGKKENLTKKTARKPTALAKNTELTADEGIEMGLIEENNTIKHIN